MAVRRSGLGRGLDALIRDPNADKINDNESAAKDSKSEKVKKKTGKTADKPVKETKNIKTNESAEKKSDLSETAGQLVKEQVKLTEIKKTENTSSEKRKVSSPKKASGRVTAEKTPEKEAEKKVRKTTVRVSEKRTVNTAEKNGKRTAIKPAGEAENKTVRKTEENSSVRDEVRENEIMVRLSLVEPNREQPRKAFSDDTVSELADSIRQYGIITPLIVQKKNDHYEIIAGERRWRAAKEAGLKEIPVLIRDYSSQEAAEIAIIENIQREDLNPMEEASAYRKLMDDFNLNQEEVATKVSKSRAAVANAMRLLKLDSRVQDMVRNGMLSEGHARAILGLENPESQVEIAEKVIDEHLNVRQTEQLVKNSGRQKTVSKKTVDPQWESIVSGLSERLKAVLGTKVAINQKTKKKGVIEIEYYSGDDLERLYELLLSIGGE